MQRLGMKVRCPLSFGHENFVVSQQTATVVGYGLGWQVTWLDVVAVGSVFAA